MRPVKKGSTNQSVVIRIIDSSDGTPENAVEHNTAGIDLWYRREGATKTSITEVALAALDTAHTDGGIELIGDGYYRLDPPDAAFAAGVNGVMIAGTVTGMIVIGCYIPLVDYDPYDSVRMGMTALPNAAADAAGGVPISDVGGLDLDSKLANTNEITVARMGALTDWIDGGRLDLLLDAIPTTAMRGTDGANTTVPDAAGVAPTAVEIQAEMEANGASILDTLRDDLADGGRLDLIFDATLAMLDDARGEPGQGNPPVNADAMTKLDYLYKWTRNQKDNDGTTTQLYNDAGAVVDQKQTTSEAAGTVMKTEIVTGP